MVALRSRHVLPPKPDPKSRTTPQPSTPVRDREPPAHQSPLSPSPAPRTGRRSSPRVASRPFLGDAPVPDRVGGGLPNGGPLVGRFVDGTSGIGSGEERDSVGDRLSGVLTLRSGRRVAKRDGEGKEEGRGKRAKWEGLSVEKVSLDSGNEATESLVHNVHVWERVGEVEKVERSELEKKPCDSLSGTSRGMKRCSSEEKRERNEEHGAFIEKMERKGQIISESGSSRGRRRYSREEKGKGKLDPDDTSALNDKDEMELDMKSKVQDLVGRLSESVALEDGKQGKKPHNGSRKDVFRHIARKNASRFAHFDAHEQEEDHPSAEAEVDGEMPSIGEEEEQKVEDWPGPFSTAMKIIRDRANKLNSPHGTSISEKVKPVAITWIPKNNQGYNRSKASLPSLQELCMRILVKNVDAIASLESVPDSLRHRLCKLLCDSRGMNSRFLGLLVFGSPTEIRIKDCSWLTEEDFMKCFADCDTSSLTVLQLDQCGRCLPDYILLPTLARSPNSLPALTTLSLKGACRLSDVGLSSLVSSSPALKSLNIGQCSLLTAASIETLANSLHSVLRELYIDDCQGMDAMLILPSLKKLDLLEVLSVAGLQTVCDDFVREFIVACGHNMKKLILADCVKLTDHSVKIIAEMCPGLCTLDLVNLKKLTDSALGYLANGCQRIQTLKLCRNSFSDEAIAAFVESSGELLKELSLNNIKQVGHNTALSLARRSKMLQTLDLSWSRNLTDEAVGLIVDSCLSLKVLKLFGCGQITNVFLDGHSNPEVKIIGLKLSSVLEHLPLPQEFPLHYS